MNRLKVVILGAIDGALYSAVMALLAWHVNARAHAAIIAQQTIGYDTISLTGHERWGSIIVIWIVIFAFTALLVDRFWTRNKYSLLFWEAIGVIAVAAWNVIVLLAVWLEDSWSGRQSQTYSWVTSSSNLIFGPISLGIVLLVNLVFALAICFPAKRLLTGMRRHPSNHVPKT